MYALWTTDGALIHTSSRPGPSRRMTRYLSNRFPFPHRPRVESAATSFSPPQRSLQETVNCRNFAESTSRKSNATATQQDVNRTEQLHMPAHSSLSLAPRACRSRCRAQGYRAEACSQSVHVLHTRACESHTLRPLRTRMPLTSSSSLLPCSRGATEEKRK